MLRLSLKEVEVACLEDERGVEGCLRGEKVEKAEREDSFSCSGALRTEGVEVKARFALKFTLDKTNREHLVEIGRVWRGIVAVGWVKLYGNRLDNNGKAQVHGWQRARQNQTEAFKNHVKGK